MARPSTFFTEVAGVPLHYDRLPPPFNYGTRGKPFRAFMSQAFFDTLDACFQELWAICPLGRAEVVTSAGAYVDKPGAHGRGRAIDIDGIFWSDTSFIALHYPNDPRVYLAIDAILRKHFGTVLNHEYNRDHRDHLHIDDLSATGFVRQHRSRVLFLQMALTHVFDLPVGIDGIAGPETARATSRALVHIGATHEPDPAAADSAYLALAEHWPAFLDATASRGFAELTQKPEPDPLQLLEHVYGVIQRELEHAPARKPIETALTAFAGHPETDGWLERFRAQP